MFRAGVAKGDSQWLIGGIGDSQRFIGGIPESETACFRFLFGETSSVHREKIKRKKTVRKDIAINYLVSIYRIKEYKR